MASVNKVILVGNLGKDPELRYTKSGHPVANFSVATTDKWQGKDGNTEERTEWHQVVVWGKSAENCQKFLGKGSTVYLEGSLQTRKWEDKAGNERYTTEVRAERVQFLGSKKSGAREAEPEAGPDPSGYDECPF